MNEIVQVLHDIQQAIVWLAIISLWRLILAIFKD